MTNSPSTRFALFDANAGFLQWIGAAETAKAALALLDADVGPVDQTELAWIQVTEAEEAALDTWNVAGSPASDFPLAGRTLNRF